MYSRMVEKVITTSLSVHRIQILKESFVSTKLNLDSNFRSQKVSQETNSEIIWLD
jgi:hypothetical protein